jgi:dTDP-glucose pyrophosphorylase
MIYKYKNWKKIVVNNKLSIKECLLKLNKIGSQILIVCSNSGTLKGTITDGDIRRGLINGFKLTSNIEKIYNDNPFVLRKKSNLKKFYKYINDYSIKIIPIIDKNKKLICAYYTGQKINLDNRSNKIIIMAGGKGERLRPLTNDIPKPMVKINGKPILEKIILNCKDSGFNNFFLSVNYLKKKIKNYFNNGKFLDVKINYLEENIPLGTLGSASLIKKEILKKQEPFIIVNGDIIANFNLKEILDFHNLKKASLTVVTRSYEVQNPYGIVQTNKSNIITSMKEKPIYNSEVLAGIYIIDYKLANLIPNKKKFDMTDLINILLKKRKKIFTYKIDNYWYEIGNISQYNNLIEKMN